ncbi:MAG: hypothetical protein WBA39_02260 [Rivularia sp. (in: cyanobacteria)]
MGRQGDKERGKIGARSRTLPITNAPCPITNPQLPIPNPQLPITNS